MKVLRVIANMDPRSGGPCQGIRNSIPELRKVGIDNEVLCFNLPDETFITEDDFPIHAIGPAKGPYAYCKKLSVWLRENIQRFDIVIIHGLWLHNSYGTYRVWKKLRKIKAKVPRLYIMPHGMLDPYFQKAEGRKLKALRNSIFWKLIEKEVVNNTDGLLFTCEQELLLAREAFPSYSPRKELNVGYGILPPPHDCERMKEAFINKCPDWNRQPFILFLSRIHEKKGVDLLIKAYNTISKQSENIPQLIIAGPGIDTPYGQTVKQLAAANNNILFCGMLTDDSKWGAFYNSQCFILPSHQENFGIAIVEAMSCHKAVLITDKVNIWREIEENGGGLVCEDNEAGVYAILKKWLSLDHEKKNITGTQAKQIYTDYFTTASFAKKLSNVFQNVQ